MIPVYNCARYLTETLESVLMQCLPEADMQIEVVDDASTDADVEALVEQVGSGRVKYFRQSENVGSLRNFESCINRSRGRLIHILHGDDRIRSGFYQKLESLLRKHPDAGAAFCGYTYMDEAGNKIFDQEPEMNSDGILPDWLPKIAERNHIQYVAVAVRREVYERLGGFYGVTYGEDWEMWTRIARYYPVAYTPEIMADYRKHTGSISGQKFENGKYLEDLASQELMAVYRIHPCSISGQKFENGKYLEDLAYIMSLIQAHLPADQQKIVLKRSKKFYAHYALRIANQLWHLASHRSGAKINIEKALEMHQSPQLYWKVAKLSLKMKFAALPEKLRRR